MVTDSTADSLRLRYRRASAAAYVPRPRPAMTPDVVPRMAVATPRRAPVRPLSRPTAQPTVQQQQVKRPTPTRPAAPQNVFSLQLDQTAAAPRKRSKYLVKPRRGMQYALTAMSLALLLLGTGVSYNALRVTKTVDAAVNKQAAASPEADVSTPSTAKPNASTVKAHTVAPDLPRFLRIPSLGVNARVKALGQTASGQIASPSNVHDAGWYKASAKPGTSGGTTIIDGHVSGWNAKGVFYKLKDLKVGSIVQVERGDGKVLEYKVVHTQVYNAEGMDAATTLGPHRLGKESLNLITCTGKVKPGTNEFEQRLVVYTERV